MKLQSTKSIKDLPIGDTLEGAELDFVDGVLKAVTFNFGDGKIVRCTNESYTFQVTVPAKPKMIEAWAVRGKIAGVKVAKNFNSSYSAEQLRDSLEDAEMRAIELPEDYDFDA